MYKAAGIVNPSRNFCVLNYPVHFLTLHFVTKFLSARHLPAFINQIMKTQHDTISLLKFRSRSTKTSHLKQYNFGTKNGCVLLIGTRWLNDVINGIYLRNQSKQFGSRVLQFLLLTQGRITINSYRLHFKFGLRRRSLGLLEHFMYSRSLSKNSWPGQLQSMK